MKYPEETINLLRKVEKKDNLDCRIGLALRNEGLVDFEGGVRPDRQYTDTTYSFVLTDKGREVLNSVQK